MVASYMALATVSPKAFVPIVPPISLVRVCGLASTVSVAFCIAAPALENLSELFCLPNHSSNIATDNNIEVELALSWFSISGAEPCCA